MYAIDLCAYDVMSNRYHLVLPVDQARTQARRAEEVIRPAALLSGRSSRCSLSVGAVDSVM
jgi:hypothetical protein